MLPDQGTIAAVLCVIAVLMATVVIIVERIIDRKDRK